MGINEIPQVTLSSGHMMPLIAMGTIATPLPTPEQLTSIFLDAIAAGYRHFDTAAFYMSEEPLGRAVAKALETGLIKSRDELFITSKLWCTDAHHDLVLPAITETLRKLDMSYVDLYLIHWPVRMKQGTVWELVNENLLPFDIYSTWKAMEQCCELGLSKSIGVSNFTCAKLHQVLHHATIPPAVNQVEMSVTWQQKKLRDFCQANRIHVSAWSPLGGNGNFWGTSSVIMNQVLKKIATAKNKSLAQIALRWVYEQGASLIVKSFNKERMIENMQIFDWELSEEENQEIMQIPQCRGFKADEFIHQNGQYKSLEELWDGEI